MASDADMEDYGFEYSDEEQEEQDVDIENQYYNSKGIVETEPEDTLSGFAEVVKMEPEKAECIPLPQWGFEEVDKDPDLAYTDQWGRRNCEYISLGVDAFPVLKGRTLVQCYVDFMRQRQFQTSS